MPPPPLTLNPHAPIREEMSPVMPSHRGEGLSGHNKGAGAGLPSCPTPSNPPSVIPGVVNPPSAIPDVVNRESMVFPCRPTNKETKKQDTGFPLTTGGNDRGERKGETRRGRCKGESPGFILGRMELGAGRLRKRAQAGGEFLPFKAQTGTSIRMTGDVRTTGDVQEGQRKRGMVTGGLSFPPVPLCHSRSGPSPSCPPGPSVMLAGLLCHSRRWLAGIQCLSLLFLHLCGPVWGKPWIPD